MNEHKKKNFETEIGQKVHVARDEINNDGGLHANQKLGDIGEFLNPKPKELNYIGSTAIHIYQSEMLGHIFFVSQTGSLGDTPEVTASTALTALKGDMMKEYGRGRQKKRSGF